MPAKLDLTGLRFSRLTANCPITGSQSSRRAWHCTCDCGNSTVVHTSALRGGQTRSCGCLKNELASARAVAMNYKHGHKTGRVSPEYHTWSSMKTRCFSPKHEAWKDYGGRGIAVCDRWRKSFADFLADVGPRPNGTVLDRINNDGNYEPGNVRWTNQSTNLRNRRTNALIEIDGVTKCAADWAAQMGVERHAILQRYQAGWRGAKLLSPFAKRTKKQPTI